MNKNKQFYQIIVKQMKRLHIIETEYITRNQMKILLDLFIQYYVIGQCNSSEIKLSISEEKGFF